MTTTTVDLDYSSEDSDNNLCRTVKRGNSSSSDTDKTEESDELTDLTAAGRAAAAKLQEMNLEFNHKKSKTLHRFNSNSLYSASQNVWSEMYFSNDHLPVNSQNSQELRNYSHRDPISEKKSNACIIYDPKSATLDITSQRRLVKKLQKVPHELKKTKTCLERTCAQVEVLSCVSGDDDLNTDQSIISTDFSIIPRSKLTDNTQDIQQSNDNSSNKKDIYEERQPLPINKSYNVHGNSTIPTTVDNSLCPLVPSENEQLTYECSSKIEEKSNLPSPPEVSFAYPPQKSRLSPTNTNAQNK